jgi:TPP-dependent pyruvate/acetoin dehydrogenase alpha subunit
MQLQPQSYDRSTEPEASESDAAGEDPVRRARDRLARAVALLEAAAKSADARCKDRLHDLNTVRAEADSLRENQSGLAERLSSIIDRLRDILGDQSPSR